MDLLLRLVLLGVLVSGSFVVVSWLQSRPVRNRSGFHPGATVYTGPDCGLCGPLVQALRLLGVNPRIVDVTAGVVPPGVRALPTVVVADATGGVVLRRSGRAALDDVITVAELARRLAGQAVGGPRL